MINEYIQARRMGLKSYNAQLQAHKNANLQTLDEIIPERGRLSQIKMGIVQIPVERIVGTSTKARAYAFAPNFMPILEPHSEFSDKWIILYSDIIESGMRSPVKVFEYLNEYYVVEGNKRVSVMKYLGALTLEAEVTRIMPDKNATDKKTHIYLEYLPFHADSGVNEIYFDKPGSFEKLIKLTGHKIGEKWSDEDSADLRGTYRYFKNEYKILYPDNPPLPVEEAFLSYLGVFGFDYAKDATSDEISASLKRMKTELERSVSDDAVNLILNRTEPPQGGILSALFRPSKIKAAFIYHRPIEDSGWNYWHNLGRISAENALDTKLEATTCVLDDPEKCEETIERLILEGNRVIFVTSPLMLEGTIRPSLNHPEIKILCCSLLASYHQVRSYYLRTYEAKFLIGMIAGAMAKNDKIGYVADYPIYGIPASINAFALGARMVNPRAQVYVEWSTKKDFDPDNLFEGLDISVISSRDINAPSHSSLRYGLYTVTENGISNIAIPFLDWGKFYETVIESVLAGSFDDDIAGVSALDYWWGMSSNAMDVILSSKFDPYVARLISAYKTLLESDQFWPFEGEMRKQNGEIVCEAPYRLTPAEILLMDYLVDNVNGSIPSVSELKENAQALVRLQGFERSIRPDETKISWKYTR